ncbi:UNVERIFIED_CONTAM: hypothetical protein FKN15_014980 [Acipenser sinensis]
MSQSQNFYETGPMATAILANMLKKEKTRAQDAVIQNSASTNGHSLSQGSLGSSGTEPAEVSGKLFSGLQTALCTTE